MIIHFSPIRFVLVSAAYVALSGCFGQTEQTTEVSIQPPVENAESFQEAAAVHALNSAYSDAEQDNSQYPVLGEIKMTPLSPTEILSVASEGLELIVNEGLEVSEAPLDSVWKDALKTATVVDQGESHYVVSFQNSTGQNLYLLLSFEGDIYDINYTGQFEAL